MSLKPGDIIGAKYQLSRKLGEGAMGEVWAAINELTGREFAIKFISPDVAENDEYAERMLREARAAGRIQHRNVVEVYDVGSTNDGYPFLVMQLLVGESLDDRFTRAGPFTVPVAASMLCDTARGLAAAHAQGVVHRDLKPANIFLHTDGEYGLVVKVVDFGVSKVASEQSATMTGTAVGSPAYMSPEQARGEKTLDHRSDIWALGVILFQLITGQLPFQGESAFDVVAEILKGPIPRLSSLMPEVDPRLDELVARCLSRDRDKRPASAAEFISLLEPFASPRNQLDVYANVPLFSQAIPPPRSSVPSQHETADTVAIPSQNTAALLKAPNTQPTNVAAVSAASVAANTTVGSDTVGSTTSNVRSNPKSKGPPIVALAAVGAVVLLALGFAAFSGANTPSNTTQNTNTNVSAQSTSTRVETTVNPSSAQAAQPTAPTSTATTSATTSSSSNTSSSPSKPDSKPGNQTKPNGPATPVKQPTKGKPGVPDDPGLATVLASISSARKCLSSRSIRDSLRDTFNRLQRPPFGPGPERCSPANTWRPAMFLMISKKSRKTNRNRSARLRAAFKAKFKRRHARLYNAGRRA